MNSTEEVTRRVAVLQKMFDGDDAVLASAACLQMGCWIARHIDVDNNSSEFRQATVEFLRQLADSMEKEFLQ